MLWSLLSVVGAGYLILAAFLFVFQANYVFFPSRVMGATPADAALAYEDVSLQTEDGESLHGWFIPAAEADLTLLFLHGNAGNISHRLESLRIFHELGLNSLIVDYRGYGRSTGKPSEQGTYRDAQAAWQHLVEHRGTPPDRIVIFGRSLGGSVAVWLAAQQAAGGLIIESTPTSIPDVGAKIYPFLPVRLLARIHYNAVGLIGEVESPVLIVHSRDDEIIPYAHGERLFQTAREPKMFLPIRGDHNAGFLISGQDYVQGLQEFLDRLPEPSDTADHESATPDPEQPKGEGGEQGSPQQL